MPGKKPSDKLLKIDKLQKIRIWKIIIKRYRKNRFYIK